MHDIINDGVEDAIQKIWGSIRMNLYEEDIIVHIKDDESKRLPKGASLVDVAFSLSEEIGMHAIRGGSIVGDHTVLFINDLERIELTHKAQSRDVLATGALVAAKFITNKDKGLFTMQDVLNLAS